MADHEHGSMDISDHQKTFVGFLNWTKWVVIGVFAVLIFMAIFTV